MSTDPGRRIGRYLVYDPIAAGGMAVVHYGRMVGHAGFTRTVAIKRLHPHLATDPEFVAMLLDEARLASRVHHPNVVGTVDVVADGGELLLVMDYVRGDSFAGLLKTARRQNEFPPVPVTVAIVVGALHGLHAAHEAVNDDGEPLSIVHRDVSPHNILVGEDGVSRIVDFGIAKAASRIQQTESGQVKGKLSYMAPEQLRRRAVDRRTDVYAAGLVLWEGLTGVRMHSGDEDSSLVSSLTEEPRPPSSLRPGIAPELDAIVKRALALDPNQRFTTAAEMAAELERAVKPASQTEVGAWVRATARELLALRSARVASIESSHGGAPLELAPPFANAEQPTLSRPVPAPRASTNVRRLMVIGGLVLALSALGVGVFAREHALPPAPSSSTPQSSSSAPPTPPSSPPSPPLPTASVPASVPPLAPSAPSSRVVGSERPTIVTRAPTVQPSSLNCNPPYTLDATGPGEPVRIYKPGCVH